MPEVINLNFKNVDCSRLQNRLMPELGNIWKKSRQLQFFHI